LSHQRSANPSQDVPVPPGTIVIDEEARIAELLSLLVQVAGSTLSFLPMAASVLYEYVPRVTRISQAAFSSFSWNRWSRMGERTALHLSRIFSTVQTLLVSHPSTVLEDVCAFMTLELMLLRISSTSTASKHMLDVALIRSAPPSARLSRRTYCNSILQALSQIDREDEATVVCHAFYLLNYYSARILGHRSDLSVFVRRCYRPG
jgi:hypothetical protein